MPRNHAGEGYEVGGEGRRERISGKKSGKKEDKRGRTRLFGTNSVSKI